ncbi:alpha-N-arabinofuranosidase A [Verticillium dahliae VdLs.17]|uniref:non-reducing end alpha-L-arabinofuranosidase n=1 Tax=Verticillium dahliae (strain VdLs.17 / ATCC MYA-4575 / FGSC 10137) TaxID=498257 RepID=G2XFI2_VERDV|nr:alpha-N-arabinofuranosidase A [Verticillium dahliae VdLs.17]EGY18580.1 alpha-N-arabinofuranosidase A [Verticillium dahliae VdLs.17]KAF3347955.1 Putative enoyl reductase [Verticillium dahliae VDG2]KAH6692008.1 alpha-N-arabinofuranosidase A [Verticillium dahliae]
MAPLKQMLLALACVASSVAFDITVASSGGNATSGHQYGFLHEDINNSGDGGIYAELIRNRAFQFSDRYPVNLDGWHAFNGASLQLSNLSEPLSDVLPVSVHVAAGNSSGVVGLSNDGYWGIDVKKQKYTGSFWVRGSYEGTFTASLRSDLNDDVFGSVDVASKAVADDWIEHEFELIPTMDAPNSNNTFTLTFDPEGAADGSLDFNLISLFPPTYKNRKNGLRVDIAESLAGLHPSLLRFPGGNMLEGNTNKTWWDWKQTLGPLRYRPGFPGVWGYQQTHGLGLLEYLQWAEDMDLEVVIGVWAGLALNGDITPKDKLQPFIDDALDQIEFIRGPADSKWGARRAELGHPEPFKLDYVEIGNEDWLAGGAAGWESYKEYRFPMFLEAINERYPDIQVIASGASSDGHDIPAPAIGDYHPYRTPDALVDEFDRFDNDVGHIVGEVAATHPNGGTSWEGGLHPFPWWIGTVGEAVSMIGYERNADRIPGTFYAPVLRNMNRWQWAVTLVQFAADAALTTRSTSWYLWELFAAHPMTRTLPAAGALDPLFYVAGRNDRAGSFIWKAAVYNTTDGADVPVTVAFEGVDAGARALLTVLSNPSADPYAYNDPFTGVNVVDTQVVDLVANEHGVFAFTLPELSVAVLDTDTKRKCKRRSQRQ